MDLAICICSNRDHHPDFSMSLLNMMARLSATPGLLNSAGVKCKTNVSCLPIGRQEMLNDICAETFSHALWIDDDMTFPADLAQRLIAAQKDLIGVNSMRKDPKRLIYTARYDDGSFVKSKGKTGIEKIGRIGLGFLLMRLEPVRKTQPPHFEIRWDDERKTYRGEDYYFIDKMKAAGSELWVDHDLSNECGHIGSIVYEYKLYG